MSVSSLPYGGLPLQGKRLTTKMQPFSFDSRDKEKLEKKQEKIKKVSISWPLSGPDIFNRQYFHHNDIPWQTKTERGWGSVIVVQISMLCSGSGGWEASSRVPCPSHARVWGWCAWHAHQEASHAHTVQAFQPVRGAAGITQRGEVQATG